MNNESSFMSSPHSSIAIGRNTTVNSKLLLSKKECIPEHMESKILGLVSMPGVLIF